MKKGVVIILMLTLFMCLLSPAYAEDKWDGTIASGFSSGEGTSSSPYLIENGEQLAYLATLDKTDKTADTKDKYYKLVADIDLNNVAWDPIMYFRGHFDGNGHTVSNLKLGNTATSSLGLFRYNYGTISDLTVENVSVNESLSNKDLGALCYSNSGTIEYCKLTGSFVIGNQYRVGGFAYSSSGIIRYSEVPNAVINGKPNYFGGIVYSLRGEAYQCRISDVRIDIEEDCVNVGGAVGTASSATISDIYVDNLSMTVGDFTPAQITNRFGGIVGLSDSTEIRNCCISSSSLNSNPDTYIHYFGGIVGELNGGSVTNCISDTGMYINETVCTWYHSVGGIAGYGTQSSVIENSISKCSFAMGVSSTYAEENALNLGGICGNNASWAYVKNCVNDSSINTLIDTSNIGYIIGAEGSTVASSDCYYNSSNTLTGGRTTSQYAGTAVSNTQDPTFLKNTVGLSEYTASSTDELAVWVYQYSSTYPDIYSEYNKCVTYSSNGGEGEPNSQFIKYLSGNTLSSQIPERENYTFKEWNTKADGTGTAYSAGQDISSQYASGFIKLYAIWEALPHTVTTITQAQGYKVCTVQAVGVPESADIIVAFYNGNKLLFASVLDDSLTVNVPDSIVYNTTKTFVWNANMKPITKQ